jgi:hypothetical protein
VIFFILNALKKKVPAIGMLQYLLCSIIMISLYKLKPWCSNFNIVYNGENKNKILEIFIVYGKCKFIVLILRLKLAQIKKNFRVYDIWTLHKSNDSRIWTGIIILETVIALLQQQWSNKLSFRFGTGIVFIWTTIQQSKISRIRTNRIQLINTCHNWIMGSLVGAIMIQWTRSLLD